MKKFFILFLFFSLGFGSAYSWQQDLDSSSSVSYNYGDVAVPALTGFVIAGKYGFGYSFVNNDGDVYLRLGYCSDGACHYYQSSNPYVNTSDWASGSTYGDNIRQNFKYFILYQNNLPNLCVFVQKYDSSSSITCYGPSVSSYTYNFPIPSAVKVLYYNHYLFFHYLNSDNLSIWGVFDLNNSSFVDTTSSAVSYSKGDSSSDNRNCIKVNGMSDYLCYDVYKSDFSPVSKVLFPKGGYLVGLGYGYRVIGNPYLTNYPLQIYTDTNYYNGGQVNFAVVDGNDYIAMSAYPHSRFITLTGDIVKRYITGYYYSGNILDLSSIDLPGSNYYYDGQYLHQTYYLSGSFVDNVYIEGSNDAIPLTFASDSNSSSSSSSNSSSGSVGIGDYTGSFFVGLSKYLSCPSYFSNQASGLSFFIGTPEIKLGIITIPKIGYNFDSISCLYGAYLYGVGTGFTSLHTSFYSSIFSGSLAQKTLNRVDPNKLDKARFTLVAFILLIEAIVMFYIVRFFK